MASGRLPTGINEGKPAAVALARLQCHTPPGTDEMHVSSQRDGADAVPHLRATLTGAPPSRPRGSRQNVFEHNLNMSRNRSVKTQNEYKQPGVQKRDQVKIKQAEGPSRILRETPILCRSQKEVPTILIFLVVVILYPICTQLASSNFFHPHSIAANHSSCSLNFVDPIPPGSWPHTLNRPPLFSPHVRPHFACPRSWPLFFCTGRVECSQPPDENAAHLPICPNVIGSVTCPPSQ